MPTLYDALIGATPSNQEALQQDPWYMSGLGIAKTPLPQAHTNADAIWGPALQGLISGALMGYGKNDAYQSAYDKIKTNPLMSALTASGAPVAQGEFDYSQPDMPEGWTPEAAKPQLILAALAKQQSDEEEQRKRDLQEQIKAKIELATNPDIINAEVSQANRIAEGRADAQKNLLYGSTSGIPGMEGIPKSLQSEVMKETNTADKLNKNKALLSDSYDTTKNISSVDSMTPFSKDAAKFNAARASILASLQSLWKGPMSDQDMKRIEPLLPEKYDSKERIDEKKSRMLKVIEANTDATPLLDSLGSGLQKGRVELKNTIDIGNDPQAFIAQLKASGVDKDTAKRLYQEKFGG